jgi:1-pyrroline-5-carboxylate dehydrogenase
VRFLARGFTVPGDHAGQTSSGLRWPYGPVALITPFNFPLEIPALQLMGALFMGNKPLLHVDRRCAAPLGQRLLGALAAGSVAGACWLRLTRAPLPLPRAPAPHAA